MARVNEESHRFTCHQHVYPYLPLLASWYSFSVRWG